MSTSPNKAPAPNRRQRFPLGRLGEFEFHFYAPLAPPAAVGEARRWAQNVTDNTGRTTTKLMRKIRLTRWAVLLSLFGILLTATSPAREQELPSGILVQTYVHDPWVINLFTGQVGGTFPFQASLRVYSVRSGRLVTTVMTDSAGHARISLRPGDYQLVPDTMQHGQLTDADVIIGRFETASPVMVRVRGHRFVPSTITYEENMGN